MMTSNYQVLFVERVRTDAEYPRFLSSRTWESINELRGQITRRIGLSGTSKFFSLSLSMTAGAIWKIRPVLNVALLPCRTQIKQYGTAIARRLKPFDAASFLLHVV